jgi:hypothetical protein
VLGSKVALVFARLQVPIKLCSVSVLAYDRRVGSDKFDA